MNSFSDSQNQIPPFLRIRLRIAKVRRAPNSSRMKNVKKTFAITKRQPQAVISNCQTEERERKTHETHKPLTMAIILGGGIGGLSAAFYHFKKFGNKQNLKLFEATNRFGGWIQTDTSRIDKNVRFESGARTLRPTGERGFNTLELCAELGLTDALLPIVSSHPAARNRMLAVNSQLYSLPSSFPSIFKTMPPFKYPLAVSLLQDVKNKYRGEPLADDSIYNFVERRFGTDVAKYLISSMMCGICAGDAKEISVKFLMKNLFEYEQQHGNITMGLVHKMFGAKKVASVSAVQPPCSLVKRARQEHWSIYSMKNGMKQLPEALIEYLQRNSVLLNLNSKCDSIAFDGEHSVTVTINGQKHSANSLISSLPAFELGRLLQQQHPILAEELNQISYVDVAVINLQYVGDLLPSPGFGFLVPPSENSPILGVIYDSACFDMGAKNTVLTVMMGGKWFASKFGDSITEAELLDKALGQLRAILKIEQPPHDCKVNVLRKCIPQYVVGHYDRIERIRDYVGAKKLPLKLCGSAIDGVGVNDVIFTAKQAIQSMESN